MHQCHPNPCPLSPQTKSWDFSKPGHHFWWPTCFLNLSLSLSLPLNLSTCCVGCLSLQEKIIPFWKDPCSSLSIALGSLHASLLNWFLEESHAMPYMIPCLPACLSCLNVDLSKRPVDQIIKVFLFLLRIIYYSSLCYQLIHFISHLSFSSLGLLFQEWITNSL